MDERPSFIEICNSLSTPVSGFVCYFREPLVTCVFPTTDQIMQKINFTYKFMTFSKDRNDVSKSNLGFWIELVTNFEQRMQLQCDCSLYMYKPRIGRNLGGRKTNFADQLFEFPFLGKNFQFNANFILVIDRKLSVFSPFSQILVSVPGPL